MDRSGGEHVGADDVVLIEPDDVVRECVGDVLSAAGRRVRRFSRVEAAARSIRERAPDVLVSDLEADAPASWPGLAAQLRSDPATQTVGLVAMADAPRATWTTLRAFDAYVTKPLDLSLLVDLTATIPAAPRCRPLARSTPRGWLPLRGATVLVVRAADALLARDRAVLACASSHALTATRAGLADRIAASIRVDLLVAEQSLGALTGLEDRVRARGGRVLRVRDGDALDPWELARALVGPGAAQRGAAQRSVVR